MSILRGLGQQSPTILKMGVDGLVVSGFHRLLLVVALGIPVMLIVNRLFAASVIVCLCKQHIAQYFGDALYTVSQKTLTFLFF